MKYRYSDSGAKKRMEPKGTEVWHKLCNISRIFLFYYARAFSFLLVFFWHSMAVLPRIATIAKTSAQKFLLFARCDCQYLFSLMCVCLSTFGTLFWLQILIDTSNLVWILVRPPSSAHFLSDQLTEASWKSLTQTAYPFSFVICESQPVWENETKIKRNRRAERNGKETPSQLVQLCKDETCLELG